MISCLRQATHCHVTVFGGIFAASFGALFAAIYSQLALGLEPCELCLYQRIPYIVAMVLAGLGLALHKNARATVHITGLCALTFLTNAGIALYHSGVELKWWASMVEGCAVPNFSADPSLLQKILTTPAASCQDIAWTDPFLGLTMANYNVAFSLLLFLGCAVTLALRQCPMQSPERSEQP